MSAGPSCAFGVTQYPAGVGLTDASPDLLEASAKIRIGRSFRKVYPHRDQMVRQSGNCVCLIGDLPATSGVSRHTLDRAHHCDPETRYF
ncbi:hypothetical protein [Mesorhizobium sp.]|uniref:hypothetical protein n=1 Tax=Mesorhizobium sp. TaxID=1871066 RepID=UPI0025D8A128|nr:hypothetical protein [Mesorhizobium sp.]